ncbi:MAG: GspH/FimT family pseudopilin [Rickettsiella sp.]|nr:GspH/FimT family pseudopilin [Rickettsiella sp.]
MARYAMYKEATQSSKLLDIKILGFSLIDLLFTLVISSILLSLVFPSYRHLIIEVRLLALTEKMTSAINYARSEALKRRSVVNVCKSSDGKTCGGQWHDGWIIFVGSYMRRPLQNNFLRVYTALKKNEFLKWHGAGGHEYLQLNPDGSARGHNGSFVICVRVLSKEKMWFIRVSATGRMRIDKEKEYRWNCNY